MTGGSTRPSPTKAVPAPITGTVVAIALAVVVPLVVVAATPQPPRDYWLGPLTILIISGLRYSWIVASRQRRLFEMVFWLFAYVFMGLAPLVQLRLDVNPGTTPNINHSFAWTASWLVILGVCAEIAGSELSGRRKDSVRLSPPTASVSWRRVALLEYVMFLGAVAYIGVIGVGSLLSYRSTLDTALMAALRDSTAVAVVAAVISVGLLVSFLGQLQVRREQIEQGSKRPSIMLWLTGILLFVIVNPLSSPRYISGTVLLAALAGLGLLSSLRRFRLVAVCLIAAMVFVFPLADAFRWSGQVDLGSGNVLDSLTSGDFDAFAQTINTVDYVHSNGITWGEQGSGALLFWVPRRLWSDKPIDTGPLVAHFRGYEYTNLSAPLFAELFINGGWATLVIGMFILGWWLRRWDDSADLVMRRNHVPSVIATIAPFYMLIMLRGSLLQSMDVLVLILVFGWFIRRPQRSRFRTNADGREVQHAKIDLASIRDGRV